MNYGQASNSSQEMTWTRPNLSANGTMGGNSFACVADSESSTSTAAYKAFDGTETSSSFWGSGNTAYPHWITFYNPTPIKVTQLTITNYDNNEAKRAIQEGTVYGSNDNSSWTTIKAFSNTNRTPLSTWTINMSNNTNYYKYYKLYASAGYYDKVCKVCEIKITATYLTTTLGNIVFPYSHANSNYAYSLAYYGGQMGGSYASSMSATGISLYNNSTGSRVYYTTMGY